MNDVIAIHLMDEKDIRNYMDEIYKLFQNNFNLS